MWKIIKRYFTSTSPKKVIEAVMKRGIGWYDFEKLDTSEKQSYYNQIQSVLRSEAFQNEVNHLMADWVQEIAESDNEPNKDKILRYSINGLKILMERLESIPDPAKEEPPKDDLFNVI